MGSGVPQQKARFSRENSRDPPREFSTPGKPLPQPYHRSDVVADAAGATSAQCVDRAVKTREWSPEIVWVVPSDRDRTYFRQNCSQEFLAGYLAAYRVEFVASLADRVGRGGEVRADCGRGHRLGPGSSVPGRRHHHAVLVLCRERRAVEPQARHHRVQRPTLVYLLDGAAIYISDPLPGCTHDAKGILPPRRSPRLSRTPVAGSWIKAQRHQRWRSDLLCAATERGILRTRLGAATYGRPTLARWRGDRGHRLGRTQQCCFYEEGSPSTGGSDSGAERSASASTRCVTPTLPRPRLRAGR